MCPGGPPELLKTTVHFCGNTKKPIHGYCVAEGEEHLGHSHAFCLSCRLEKNECENALGKWLNGFDERYAFFVHFYLTFVLLC
jgi:hypothetical protein